MTAQNRLITLNNGVQMPILSFGVFQVPEEQAEQAVTDALAADGEMTRIAALGTGATVFFGHHDPGMVIWLGGRRVD